MPLKIWTPPQSERNKFFPLSLLTYLTVTLKKISESLNHFQSHLNGSELNFAKEHLITLAIARLNAFHDDGFAIINQIHKHYSQRLPPYVRTLYDRIASGNLVWIRDFRDTFIGHVPVNYDQLQDAVPQKLQHQMLQEIPAIVFNLEQAINTFKISLSQNDVEAFRKVHNAENLKAAQRWDPNILNTFDQSTIDLLIESGVLENIP